jgi:hypothetical protein
MSDNPHASKSASQSESVSGIAIAVGHRLFVSAIEKKSRKPIAIPNTDSDSNVDADSECGGDQAAERVIYP